MDTGQVCGEKNSTNSEGQVEKKMKQQQGDKGDWNIKQHKTKDYDYPEICNIRIINQGPIDRIKGTKPDTCKLIC